MKRYISIMMLPFLLLLFAGSDPVSAQEREIQQEIFYHILIDRFNNMDHSIDNQVDLDNPYAYHGGDLVGITKKLDDLKDIGVTAIVISPVMANAPNGYHGYWIQDFYEMEEQFGTMEDFHTLIEEAHNRDIKVVMEFVLNYVSPTNEIVLDSNKEDWFMEVEEQEPAWTEEVVQLNLEHPEVATYMKEIADYWMNETAIDGFMLHAVDVAPTSFLKDFTTYLKEKNPQFYLLGDLLYSDENREEILSSTEMDVIDQWGMQQAMTEVFSALGNPVSSLYDAWTASGNNQGLLFVDDMYTKRFTQSFAENGRNPLTAWQLALTFMYTAPGNPILFQGSEIPMLGTTEEEIQHLVLFNSGDPDLKEYYDRISSLRSSFPVFQYGDFELVDSSGAMSVFKRSYEGQTVYIAINNDEESQYVDVSDVESGMQLRGFLGDNLVRENEEGNYRIGLARETAEVFLVQEDRGFNWGLIGFAGGVFIIFVAAVIYLSVKEKRRNREGKQ